MTASNYPQALASRILDVLWRVLSARAAACAPGLAIERSSEVGRRRV